MEVDIGEPQEKEEEHCAGFNCPGRNTLPPESPTKKNTAPVAKPTLDNEQLVSKLKTAIEEAKNIPEDEGRAEKIAFYESRLKKRMKSMEG